MEATLRMWSQLRADSANKKQGSKVDNLEIVQQGAGRREPAIGGDFSNVEPSSNEKFGN